MGSVAPYPMSLALYINLGTDIFDTLLIDMEISQQTAIQILIVDPRSFITATIFLYIFLFICLEQIHFFIFIVYCFPVTIAIEIIMGNGKHGV